MAYSNTIPFDGTGSPEVYTVKTICKMLRLYENDQLGSTDIDLYMPSDSSTPVRVPAGAQRELHRPGGAFWQPGEKAFAVNAVTNGSWTLAVEEH